MMRTVFSKVRDHGLMGVNATKPNVLRLKQLVVVMERGHPEENAAKMTVKLIRQTQIAVTLNGFKVLEPAAAVGSGTMVQTISYIMIL